MRVYINDEYEINNWDDLMEVINLYSFEKIDFNDGNIGEYISVNNLEKEAFEIIKDEFGRDANLFEVKQYILSYLAEELDKITKQN